MTNFNYRKGRAKEYRIAKRLQKDGYITIRSAGSHSFADLVAIHPDTRTILFIQSKPKNFSQNKMNELIKKYAFLKGEFKVAFGVE